MDQCVKHLKHKVIQLVLLVQNKLISNQTGKVIQVTCPLCSHKFNIQFNFPPLQILFKWNKQQRLKENIITIKNRFNALQPKDTSDDLCTIPLFSAIVNLYSISS